MIIWNKATRVYFEVFDMVLEELRHSTRLIAGATVLLAGGFRQTLPVMPKGTKADELNAIIKFFYL